MPAERLPEDDPAGRRGAFASLGRGRDLRLPLRPPRATGRLGAELGEEEQRDHRAGCDARDRGARRRPCGVRRPG